jgi:hypothetical protein
MNENYAYMQWVPPTCLHTWDALGEYIMVEWGSVEIRIDGSKWDEERTCASWDLLHIIEHALGGRLSSPFLSLLVSNLDVHTSSHL